MENELDWHTDNTDRTRFSQIYPCISVKSASSACQKYKTLTEEELFFCKNNNYVIERDGTIDLFVENENESNNEFGINDEKFSVNDEKFSVNDEKFGINDEKFGVNDEKFGINDNEFGINDNEFGINQKKILSLIDENPVITANEIAYKLNIRTCSRKKLGKTKRNEYYNSYRFQKNRRMENSKN